MEPSSDIPPGDERRPGYYEKIFGERIEKISKAGTPAPSRATSPSSGRGTGIGVGAILAIIMVVVRIIGALSHTSSTPSYPDVSVHYPKVEIPEPLVPREPDLDRWLKENPVFIDAAPRDIAPELLPVLPQGDPSSFLLRKGDIPLFDGLCLHLFLQHRQPHSVGKHIADLIGPGVLELIRKGIVAGGLLPEEEARILDALNKVLRLPGLYEPDAFRDVVVSARLRTLALQVQKNRAIQDASHVIPLNRWLLEAAYSEQIIPQHLRAGPIDHQRRMNRAREDKSRALQEATRHP